MTHIATNILENRMNLPDDYFLDTDDEMLAYLEQCSTVLLDDLYESIKRNKEKAMVLFNLLLSGSGGAFLLWATHHFSYYLGLAILSVSILWGLSAIYLLISTISLKMRPARGNSPENLYIDLYKNFDEYQDWRKSKNIHQLTSTGLIRRFELHNINQSIIDLMKTNKRQVKHMNNAMYFSALIPLLGMLIA